MSIRPNSFPLKLRLWFLSLMISSISALISSLPLNAAEEIRAIFGPAKLSIRTESLEELATEGTVNQNLAFYLNLLGANSQDITNFRNALNKRADLDPLLVARILNTGIGETLLERLGRLINIQGGRNGKFALRAALIQAALDPQEGLTLMNFFRKLPTNMEVDLSNVMRLSRSVDIIVKATKEFTVVVAELSAAEAKKAQPVDFSQLPQLDELGEFGVAETEIWQLTDTTRNRRFSVNVYKPQRWREGQIPVIVASHGLASNPEHFEQAGKHLASYGYLVVAPQHPGSDLIQAKRIIDGTSREIFILEEFIDRPKDISYTLDELERRNPSEFAGRLNLQSVGVIGHSFGAYTALAVAGATIDFDFLEYECGRRFVLNTALLLQCQALRLPRQEYNFRDERVTSVVLANPVNSAIFGPQGLGKVTIPLIIGAGTYDPATPIIFEQGRSFPWLSSENRYLFVIEGQAHVDVATLDIGLQEVINSIENITLPYPALIHKYESAMVTAFFGVYLLEEEATYQPYLQSSYAAYLSQGQEFKAFLITNASTEELNARIEQFNRENPLPR